MKYKVIVLQSALKSLEKIDHKFASKIKKKIYLLESDPRHEGSIKLSGEKNSYRTRVGDYRIIYEIHDSKVLIIVVRLGHRKDIYER